LDYDILIKGGKVVDGSGNPWYKGDIAVNGDRIACIARDIESDAEQVIDATGLVLAPGFIDAHSHADSSTLFYREMESVVAQGITTVVAGQCGSSIAPVHPGLKEELEKRWAGWLPPEVEFEIIWTTFEEYLREEEKDGLGANVAHLVGHGAVRIASIGFEARAPTAGELEAMRGHVAEAMKAGAFGLSTGLIYPPGIFAETPEIMELAKVAAEYGGIYDTHIRGEGKTLMESLSEAISIGKEAGIPVQISHHKAATKSFWGKSEETLALLEETRLESVDITVDQYPYKAGSTSLVTCLPPWAHEGGMERLLERLKDPGLRMRIQSDIIGGLPGWENFAGELGWENVYVTSVKTDENEPVEGKNLHEIQEHRGDTDPYTSLFDLILEEEGAAGMVIFAMGEEDVRRIMRHPLQMVGTDSGASGTTGFMRRGKPHPRGYGSYPKILGRYVRDNGILTLEEAIRKMTSFPAQRFGLFTRGLLKLGMQADLVVFNPETVIDTATYQDPHQLPRGIEHVIVNGELAVHDSKPLGTLFGRTLRKDRDKPS
jgi:N-acyl-D-amino-acid deacylase